MDKDMGLLLVLGVVAVALMGGVKNVGLQPINTNNQTQSTASIEQKIQDAQIQVDNIGKQIQLEVDKKNLSQYKGVVTLAYVNRTTDSSQEYVAIKMDYNSTSTIPVTGWILKSLSTNNQITIPQATYLYFTGMLNTKDNIFLTGGDTLYLVTGVSPNGASFRVNKCSGYLAQFQTFVPYLSTSCPLPRNENLSSIPSSPSNDACFDFIDSMGQCRIAGNNLPTNLSGECINFIQNKINYPSCVDTHKNDKDFYQKEWRIYLNRGSTLWKTERETVVLYDNNGKIVDTLKY